MIIHEATKSLLLRSRQPYFINQTIPKSKLVDIAEHNVAVKHGVEEVQVLRNMGIQAPSPILHYYNWPGLWPPMAHQRETSAFVTYHRRGFVLNDMGTGKTASILWALDFLMTEKLVKRALIVAPLSTLTLVWRDEIFRTLMHRTAMVLHGTRERRFSRLEEKVDFYIVNHDGLPIIHNKLLERPDIDTLVIDEASVYRNGQTQKYKDLAALVKKRPDMRVYLMTGAPCPNAPTDAWALAKLINPSKVPGFFGAFRSKIMRPFGPYKWLPKPGALEEAYKVMQPAVRFRKSECIDLPPVTVEPREVELTAEQLKAYKDMKDHMRMAYNDLVLSGQLNAVNAADQLNKLRQIFCGVVKVPGSGDYVEIDHAPRVSVLLENIEQASAKVIVVVPFKGIIKSLANDVSKHFSCEIVNGDVSITERNDIFNRFKGFADPHVLLCHPKVMSHGLNMTEADTMVFYAPIYSNDEYQQVIERMARPGQKRKMTIIRMGAHWIEWSIYKQLDNRKMNQDGILALYEQAMKELT